MERRQRAGAGRGQGLSEVRGLGPHVGPLFSSRYGTPGWQPVPPAQRLPSGCDGQLG